MMTESTFCLLMEAVVVDPGIQNAYLDGPVSSNQGSFHFKITNPVQFIVMNHYYYYYHFRCMNYCTEITVVVI